MGVGVGVVVGVVGSLLRVLSLSPGSTSKSREGPAGGEERAFAEVPQPAKAGQGLGLGPLPSRDSAGCWCF